MRDREEIQQKLESKINLSLSPEEKLVSVVHIRFKLKTYRDLDW